MMKEGQKVRVVWIDNSQFGADSEEEKGLYYSHIKKIGEVSIIIESQTPIGVTFSSTGETLYFSKRELALVGRECKYNKSL